MTKMIGKALALLIGLARADPERQGYIAQMTFEILRGGKGQDTVPTFT